MDQLTNLSLNDTDTPTLKQRVKDLDDRFLNGYLRWYLDYWNGDGSDILYWKSSLMKNDVLLWTQACMNRHEELVFMELSSIKMNIAFLSILSNDDDESDKWINSTNDTLDRMNAIIQRQSNPVKHPLHLKGVQLLLDSLRVLKGLQFNQDTGITELILTDPKVQAVFKMGETKFVEKCSRNSSMKQLELVEEAIKLDPDWEWYLFQYKLIRWARKDANRFDNQSEEQAAIENVMRSVPKNRDHPPCRAKYCEMLCQLLGNNPEFPLTLYPYQFSTRERVVRYLKNSAEGFIENYASPAWMMTFALIFSHLRPERDADFALRLLNKGLQTAPESTKLNHRKAILLSTVKKRYREADECIRLAVQSDRGNKSAVIDMAKLFLRHDDLSPIQINELQEECFSDWYFDQWDDDKKPSSVVDLIFFKGCFLMKTDHSKESIKVWLDWARLVNMNEGRNNLNMDFSFKQLGYLERWGWSLKRQFDRQFIDRIRQTLQTFKSDHPGQRQTELRIFEAKLSQFMP